MGKPQAKFNSKDLVRSLEEVMRAPEHVEGMTLRELKKATGKADDWLRQRLYELHDRGKLEVKKAPRESIDGAIHPVPVYRLRTKA